MSRLIEIPEQSFFDKMEELTLKLADNNPRDKQPYVRFIGMLEDMLYPLNQDKVLTEQVTVKKSLITTKRNSIIDTLSNFIQINTKIGTRSGYWHSKGKPSARTSSFTKRELFLILHSDKAIETITKNMKQESKIKLLKEATNYAQKMNWPYFAEKYNFTACLPIKLRKATYQLDRAVILDNGNLKFHALVGKDHKFKDPYRIFHSYDYDLEGNSMKLDFRRPGQDITVLQSIQKLRRKFDFIGNYEKLIEEYKKQYKQSHAIVDQYKQDHIDILMANAL